MPDNSPLADRAGFPSLQQKDVHLMHVRKFAAAQAMFEQAIHDYPNFAEAHNNLGFTLRQQACRTMRKRLNITIRHSTKTEHGRNL